MLWPFAELRTVTSLTFRLFRISRITFQLLAFPVCILVVFTIPACTVD